ncbi:hypothetical protein TI01_0293 [Lysobacter sp. A03]|nr:hypothetical protein TI01_0293 [Lysobacter sp. A03]
MQAQRDVAQVELGLQRRHGGTYPGSVVLVHARIDMRAAGDFADAVGGGDARHVQRHVEINRAIVDAGKDVAVEIKHRGGRSS